MTRLFEKEYGLPVNSNPTDPRSRVRTFRMAALFSDHRFTSAQIALLEQVRWSNAYCPQIIAVWAEMDVTEYCCHRCSRLDRSSLQRRPSPLWPHTGGTL